MPRCQSQSKRSDSTCTGSSKTLGRGLGPLRKHWQPFSSQRSSGGPRRLNCKTCLTLPVRQAELDIPKLAKKAVDGYRVLLACTKSLTESLLNHTDLDAAAYNSSVEEARAQMRKTKALLGLADLQLLCKSKVPFVSQQMKRSKETGAWLNNLPNTLNGTVDTIFRIEIPNCVSVRRPFSLF